MHYANTSLQMHFYSHIHLFPIILHFHFSKQNMKTAFWGSKAFNAICNENYLGNESTICNWSAKNKAFWRLQVPNLRPLYPPYHVRVLLTFHMWREYCSCCYHDWHQISMLKLSPCLILWNIFLCDQRWW